VSLQELSVSLEDKGGESMPLRGKVHL